MWDTKPSLLHRQKLISHYMEQFFFSCWFRNKKFSFITPNTRILRYWSNILFPTDLPLCSQQETFIRSKPSLRWSITSHHVHICNAYAFLILFFLSDFCTSEVYWPVFGICGENSGVPPSSSHTSWRKRDIVLGMTIEVTELSLLWNFKSIFSFLIWFVH